MSLKDSLYSSEESRDGSLIPNLLLKEVSRNNRGASLILQKQIGDWLFGA